MGVVKTYGNIIKHFQPAHPEVSRRMITAGLFLERFRARHLSDQRIPKAYVELNTLAVGQILHGLKHPETTAWTNLFTPVEILQCFDLFCLSAEALSSFWSGFFIEDRFIDDAEAAGFAPTLCSYHKCFLGSALSGVMRTPSFAVTTSTVCDANFNTFRFIEKHCRIPTVFLDIPAVSTPESIQYVSAQLKELIHTLEEHTGKSFDVDRLREILQRENQSKDLYLRYLLEKAEKTYPTTLTLQMYELFATHLAIGSVEALHFFQSLYDEVRSCPTFHGKRIYWVHLLPFYHDTLQNVFNLSDTWQLQGFEMNIDYTKPLDLSDPLTALAKKLIENIYNRPFEEKIDLVLKTAHELRSDGLIHFCHWGCKQSIGGAMRLKEAAAAAGYPILLLDGDAIDRRNSADGQIRTRLDAFLELLNENGAV
ncbi:MAG: 2-hydroxyacyl-CoA dehydratase [Lachnospiraceae bacterium]|nr:2-hydroxyacyl-CoA dehydratase [Lachnospiraceae bacterium]